jgi:hypothetical protein
LPTTRHRIFRAAWRSSNVLLTPAVVAHVNAGDWEVSVRRYLKGLSDATAPIPTPPEQKAEATLDWMRGCLPRSLATDHQMRIPRFHFLEHVARAGASFLFTSEIE